MPETIDIAAQPYFKWMYASESPLRTGAAYGKLSDGCLVIAFGDLPLAFRREAVP